MTAYQKQEQARLIAIEQNRIAEEQRRERNRIAEEKRQREQEEYDRWFASLTKEQQVKVMLDKEETERANQRNTLEGEKILLDLFLN